MLTLLLEHLNRLNALLQLNNNQRSNYICLVIKDLLIVKVRLFSKTLTLSSFRGSWRVVRGGVVEGRAGKWTRRETHEETRDCRLRIFNNVFPWQGEITGCQVSERSLIDGISDGERIAHVFNA